MCLKRLKDVTKKSSLLRCVWEVFEMSLSMEICLRSLRDISCWVGQYFFTYWKCGNIQNIKNKIDELTDMINFGEFPLISLESLSVVTQCIMYVIFMKKINQVEA